MRARTSALKLRKMLFERDHGICVTCQIDCEKAKRVFWAILDFDAQCFYGQLLSTEGRVFWEADHIQEVASNGSDSLRNLQTLCMVCHKLKTSEFMKRLRASILNCSEHCDDAAHAETLFQVLGRRYDAEYFVGDNGRFVVNIGPGLKSDYMERMYAQVGAHRHQMAAMIAESHAVIDNAGLIA